MDFNPLSDEWFWHKSSSEAVSHMCSVKEVFLEILQNSQENTCTRAFFLTEHIRWLLLPILRKTNQLHAYHFHKL